VLPRSGRPAFLVVPKLWRDRSRTGAEPEFDFGFDVSLRAHRVGRFGAAMRFNPAQTTMRHSCDAKENGPDRGPVSASWLGHVVAAIGRHFWRAEYGGTAASATAS
jgi:hypothetical protein